MQKNKDNKRPYNFHITTVDWYIIRKFIGTYFFAILIIIGIVIIFDISEKIDDFVDKEAPLRAVVVDYYMNFIPYFMNMFSPLFVFISVISLLQNWPDTARSLLCSAEVSVSTGSCIPIFCLLCSLPCSLWP